MYSPRTRQNINWTIHWDGGLPFTILRGLYTEDQRQHISCRSADDRTQLCHTRSYSVICWSRLDDYGWTMADGNPISSTIHVNDFPTHATISQTNQTLFRFRPGCPTDLYVWGGGGEYLLNYPHTKFTSFCIWYHLINTYILLTLMETFWGTELRALFLHHKAVSSPQSHSIGMFSNPVNFF